MYDFESDARRVAMGALRRGEFLRRGLAAGVSVTFLGQVLAACGSGSGSGGSAGASTLPSGAPRNGNPPATPTGRLVVGDVQAPRTANWDAAGSFGGYDIRLYSLLYEPLIDLDENGNLVPMLATKWERLSPTTVRVTLREGVKFHDGSPLRAQDVKATLDRLGTPNSTVLYAVVFAPLHCEIRNARTIDIVCDKPLGVLERALPFARIMSAKVLASPALLKRSPVGTGPFRYVSRNSSQTVLEANPDYWQPGKPHVKSVVFQTIPDQSARINALQTGTIDVMVEASTAQIDQFKPDSRFYIPPPRFYTPAHFFYYLRQKGPLADARVRQAFAYAIDRKAIASTVFRGVQAVGYSPIPTTSNFYTPLEPRYDHDPAKAKALLAQAGYANGLTITMPTSATFQEAPDCDAAVMSYLKAVGVTVNATRVDVATYSAGVETSYDMTFGGSVEVTGDADSILVFFRQPLLKLEFNSDDKKMDQLANAQRALSGSARQAAVTAAAQYIWQQQPALFLTDYYFPEVVAKRVQNYTPTRAFGLVGLKDVWVS